METKKSKISFYNDGLIGSISSHCKRSKQELTIWSVDFTKDQGKKRTLRRKKYDPFNDLLSEQELYIYVARATLRSNTIVYKYETNLVQNIFRLKQFHLESR